MEELKEKLQLQNDLEEKKQRDKKANNQLSQKDLQKMADQRKLRRI